MANGNGEGNSIFDIEDLENRVRSIIGVPSELLSDEVISSPTFLIKSEKYILKSIGGEEKISQLDENLLKIAYLYYICYLLCPGMYARVPKQMENLSTKTILLSINWADRAMEMLDLCNQTISDALEEIGETLDICATFATLSGESEYPNTNI